MNQLIPIINELHNTYAKLDIKFMDLPQIVIIGSQSAGKSSVLENIVKREFLPRGTGIVTRCPLILKLINEPGPSKGTRGQFLHTGSVNYFDFNEIKDEIERQTVVLAGDDKNITDKPITLTIFSPEFPDLTLIDLPGLTKVALDNQVKEIPEQIKNICEQYARTENSIMLAISAGNADLATSDALQFAEELDPEGKRTLCVITKLDIMDKGTNARDILTGRIHPKKLGYIGVVNRCQEDIQYGKPIDESLCEEKRFLEKHYPDIAHKNGTVFLTQNLNKLLKRHIKKSLPTVRDSIKDQIRATLAKLELLGPEIVDKRLLIPKFLNGFMTAYSRINDGDFDTNLSEIRGGALISQILYEEFPKNLVKIDVEANLTDEVILATIRNTCGSNKMSFSREKAFKGLVREQISKLENPSLRCIDDVFEKLMDFVVEASAEVQLTNFPNLIQRIIQETHLLIKISFKNTQSLIKNLIQSEKTDVMCSHPNYKLGFVLEKMNYQNFPNAELAILEQGHKSQEDIMIEMGFKTICQGIANNLPDFCRILIYFLKLSKKTLEVLDVFKSQNHTIEEKRVLFDQILDNIFVNAPEIRDHKNTIIDTMMSPDSMFYDCLVSEELKYQQEKSTELRLPVNETYESAVLKDLVVEYFNIVRQHVCYYIPKLIKTFLVIHVRENLTSHLQSIYNDSNIDFLLYEADSVYTERKNMTELLQDLENIRNRIEDIFSDA